MKTLKAESAAKIQCGIARKCDFEKLSVDDILAIKGDDSVTHYRFSEREVRGIVEGGGDQRTFEHDASVEVRDSMSDLIRSKGWNLIRLRVGKIPLFYGHNPDPVPMGLVLGGKQGKTHEGFDSLQTTSRFHEAEIFGESDWGQHVESIRTLVSRGDLPGVSVGFVPEKMHRPTKEEVEQYELDPWSAIFDEQELLELSVTPIPANNRAQQRRSLKVTRAALESLVAEGRLEAGSADALAEDLCGGEDVWMRRATQLGRTVVPVTRDLPWLKGAPATKDAPAEASEIVKAIEKAALSAIASIQREAAAAVRRECSAVIRETLGGMEDSMVSTADRIEEALVAFRATTSERAEGSTPSEPQGSNADPAASTGTSRESPIQPTPAPSLATTLIRALAADSRTDADNAHSRPGQAGSLQG